MCIFLSNLLVNSAFSQISPPGLGKTKMAGWIAVGVRQELDTVEDRGWQSMTYIGVGRKSNPGNYNLFYRQAIWVFNQEFYHRIKSWQYSVALSYRRQDDYLPDPPYEYGNPKLHQEFRLYGRLSYILNTSCIKLTPTFRQEFRRFYSAGFKNVETNFQFRSRFRLQLTASLSDKREHRLILSSEQLFSTSKESISGTWTGFNYNESRFALYYSYSPEILPLVFSIGYINNLVGQKNPFDAHYFVFDIIIKNPFKLKRYDKAYVKENFE